MSVSSCLFDPEPPVYQRIGFLSEAGDWKSLLWHTPEKPRKPKITLESFKLKIKEEEALWNKKERSEKKNLILKPDDSDDVKKLKEIG